MNQRLQKGSIFVYRVFDVAEEINLLRVEQILSHQAAGETRLQLAVKTRDAVIVRNAPVRLNLGELDLPGVQNPLFRRAIGVATIWDYGAVSIALQFPIQEPIAWEETFAISAFLNTDSRFLTAVDSLAKVKAAELSQAIGRALTRPVLWRVFEDYIIYFLEEVGGFESVQDFSTQANLPELLLGEQRGSLSPMTRESILENMLQYAANDLTLIDWNAAIVLEPSGNREILDILEFALTHLLEVRYYDELLDLRLTELYDSVEQGRSRLVRNPYASISKEANTRFIEFTEFMERMDNSLKVVGDFYLARIFRGAIRRFRISDWEESITRKMNLLARVSELLQGENNVRRSHFLEMIVILLIAFEIVSAILLRH